MKMKKTTLHELNTIFRAVEGWVDDYATKEIRIIMKACTDRGIDTECIDDRYIWMNGEPATKERTYRLIDSKTGDVIESILVINRYYGNYDNGHCELTGYFS